MKRLEISFNVQSCRQCTNIYNQDIKAYLVRKKPEIIGFTCPADGRIVEMPTDDFCVGIDPDCPLPDAEDKEE